MPHDAKPAGGVQPTGPVTEASENTTPEYLWEHRPELLPRQAPKGLDFPEDRVCSLPHGGMSPEAQKQLAEITARRAADKRGKEEEAQQAKADGCRVA